MKIEIGTSEVDGFVRHFLLRIDDGLMLRSHHTPLPFAGKEGRETIFTQMRSLIAQFEKDGHEVVGKELLEKAA